MSAKRPLHHANSQGTLFKNPWPSAAPPSWSELALGGIPLSWGHPDLDKHPHARDIQVVEPDWGQGESKNGKGKDIKATWLGHASAYVELPWAGAGQDGKLVRLLFDPMFSSKAGPTAYTGPSRLKRTPYDHLDYSTILSLKRYFPEALYFVPLRNKQWFVSSGILEEKVVEMDWWEDVDLYWSDKSLSFDHVDDGSSSPQAKLRFTCVPAQHNSGRGARDQSATLWSGWTVEQLVSFQPGEGEDSSTARVTRKGAIYFAGDTGYRRYTKSDAVCPAFEEIGAKLGPFDVSFVPIWRGGTLGFISWAGLRLDHDKFPSAFHGSPTDAVAMHLDVKSRNTIGIHFGTFIGAEAESLEAVIELQEACEDAGLKGLEDKQEGENGRMGVLDIGETYVVGIEDLAIF
ncbi:hypothetical protein MNV49_006639 [Pseudohyphozyma bogoriensis]|nr:hypothetical protein MNV49_006639 [Pseudohyphozyma bogoriensis]